MRLDSLGDRLGAVEDALRTSVAPTATAHALLDLEASMLARLRGISEVMSLLLGRVARRLEELSSETGSDTLDPAALLAALQAGSGPSPGGRSGSTRRARRRAAE